MYVEELIGPDTVNTMPLETLEAFHDHGEVRGDTVLEGVDEAEQLLDDARDAGVDYDDVVDTLEVEGVQKFADAFDELIEGIAAQAGRAGGHLTTERRELVARIWSRDPTVWTGTDEAPLARLARRAVAHARATSTRCCGSPTTCSTTSTTVVLLGMGGSSLAPEVLRRAVRRRALPRPRHDPPGRSARLDRRARPRAHALRLGVEVGLDARDALAHRLLLEARAARRAVGRDHRPGLGAGRARARARVRRDRSRASRRSAAATRRCPRSGSCRPR